MLLLLPVGLACEVSTPTTTLHRVEVQPDDAEPFAIDLQAIPTQVVWRKGEAVLQVLEPLAFATATSAQDLPLRTRQPLALYDGRLSLAAGTAPIVTEASEGHVTTTLPLQGFDTPVDLPCTALTLDEALPTLADLDLPARPHRFATPRSLALHTAPHSDDPWAVSTTGPLQVVAERDGWVELVADYTDGSRLWGWTPAADLSIQRGRPLLGHRAQGGRSAGHCSRSHGPGLETVTLPVGTPLYDRAAGVVWATVSRSVPVGVFPPDADGWVRVGHAPGLPVPCDEHERIWLAPPTEPEGE